MGWTCPDCGNSPISDLEPHCPLCGGGSFYFRPTFSTQQSRPGTYLLDSDSISSPEALSSTFSDSIGGSAAPSSVGAYDIQHLAADFLANVLWSRTQFKSLYLSAIIANVGSGRLSKGLARVLRRFGTELKQDEGNDMPFRAETARIICRRARQIAIKISQFTRDVEPKARIAQSALALGQRENVENWLVSALSNPLTHTESDPKATLEEGADDEVTVDDDDDDDDDDDEPHWDDGAVEYDILPLTEKLGNDLTQSKAYQAFLSVWQRFVQTSKLRKILTSRSLEDLAAPERRDIESLGPYLSVATDTVRIHDDFQQTWIEQFQCWVERETHTEWHWWPLAQARQKRDDGYGYLSWTCGCGMPQWAPIPHILMPNMKAFIREVESQSFPEKGYQKTASSGVGLVPMSISPLAAGKPATAGHAGTSGIVNPSNTNINTTPTAQQPDSSQALKTNTAANVSPTQVSPSYVFLCVPRGSSFKLAQLDVTHGDDDQFFDILRREYDEGRGWSRRWFSIFRYDGCNFVQAEKYEKMEHAPGDIGMPPKDDKEYEFIPKPADPMPPVSRHEFWRRYHYCYKGEKKHFRWFGKCCTGLCRGIADCLERVPKRDRKVLEEISSREIYWGLQAIEKPHALRLFLYYFGLLLSTVGFCVWWLVQHEGDLQNASVPITVAISALALLLSSWTLLKVSPK